MATQAKALLTDVEVEEVSMVDRAANKRKFLVTKNADGESTPADAGPPPATPDPAPAPAVPPDPPVNPTPPAQHADTNDSSLDDPGGGTEQVAKRGAKMAKKRLERFAAAIAELGAVLKELQDAGDDAGATEETEEKVAKSAEPNPLEAKLAELTGKLAELVAKSEAQAKEIATQKEAIAKQAEIIKAAKTPAPPNSSSPEGITKAAAKPFVWPEDLNEERS